MTVVVALDSFKGCFDDSSLDGKVVSGVAQAAREAGVPVVVFAGEVRLTPEVYQAYGITSAHALRQPGMSASESLRRAPELLQACAAQWLRSVERVRQA